MTLQTTIWMGLLLTGACEARVAAPDGSVDVYIINTAAVPGGIESCAMQLAAKIFSQAEVPVRFHVGDPHAGSLGKPILVHLLHEPTGVTGTTLGFAFPYEGSRIDILYERVRRGSDRTTSVRLGYVLVHEITHVLQGVAIHAPEGLMKALWNQNDEFEMERGTLRLSEDDVEAIRRGLTVRQH